MCVQSRRFLRDWVLACIVLAAVVAVFDTIVDPYLLFGVPRVAGFNARKPAVDTQERIMKAYDALRATPNTLILGPSTVDLGLDAQDPAWPVQDRPLYNLGLAAASPYTSYRYLQHVTSRRHLALVVLGLDFGLFLLEEAGRPPEPEFESHLAVGRDGSAKEAQGWRYMRDIFEATLSLDAVKDSAATLAANFSGESSNLVAGDWDYAYFRRSTAAIGSYPIVAQMDLDMIRVFRKLKSRSKINQLALADVRAILDLCESHETRVILLINPEHVDALEIWDLTGYWKTFEDWKRELLALTEMYPRTNGASLVQLWDFSGYDSYSTESVPMGQNVLHWFWDPIHYKRALGDVIVKRMFGTGGGAHFGVRLSVENFESHLAAIREERRLYREHHPTDVRRVYDLYESMDKLSSMAAEKVPRM